MSFELFIDYLWFLLTTVNMSPITVDNQKLIVIYLFFIIIITTSYFIYYILLHYILVTLFTILLKIYCLKHK